MSSSELARASGGLVPASAELPLPDGPASLWFVVRTEAGEIMGAARADVPPEWLWRDGALCIAYGEVRVVMTARGVYDHAVMVAIAQVHELAALAGQPGPFPYAPIFRIGLGERHELRAGDDMHILDGVIAISPEAAPGKAEPLR